MAENLKQEEVDVLHADVTIKFRIENVCSKSDIKGCPEFFEQLVHELIVEEGIAALIGEFTTLKLEKIDGGNITIVKQEESKKNEE